MKVYIGDPPRGAWSIRTRYNVLVEHYKRSVIAKGGRQILAFSRVHIRRDGCAEQIGVANSDSWIQPIDILHHAAISKASDATSQRMSCNPVRLWALARRRFHEYL